jgi:hypothetical protein
VKNEKFFAVSHFSEMQKEIEYFIRRYLRDTSWEIFLGDQDSDTVDIASDLLTVNNLQFGFLACCVVFRKPCLFTECVVRLFANERRNPPNIFLRLTPEQIYEFVDLFPDARDPLIVLMRVCRPCQFAMTNRNWMDWTVWAQDRDWRPSTWACGAGTVLPLAYVVEHVSFPHITDVPTLRRFCSAVLRTRIAFDNAKLEELCIAHLCKLTKLYFAPKMQKPQKLACVVNIHVESAFTNSFTSITTRLGTIVVRSSSLANGRYVAIFKNARLPEWLCDLLKDRVKLFDNTVRVLKFGNTASHGILIPVAWLQGVYIWETNYHASDLSSILELTYNPIPKTRHLAYRQRCIVSNLDLFAECSTQEFCKVVWRIGTKPDHDMVLKLLTTLLTREHFESRELHRFLNGVTDYSMEVNAARIVCQSGFEAFPAVFLFADQPDLLKCILFTCKRLQITIHQANIAWDGKKVLCLPQLPLPIKRLVIDTSRCSVEEITYPIVELWPDCPTVQLFHVHEFEDPLVVCYDRVANRVVNVATLRASGQTCMSLKFYNEPGVGVSAHAEVLKHMWVGGIQSGLVCFHDDSGLFFQKNRASDRQEDDAFALGMVSAWSLKCGMYLPFAMADDFWVWMFRDRISDSSALRDMQKKTDSLTNQAFAELTGSTNRKKTLREMSMPYASILNQFKLGFDKMVPTRWLLPLQHMNALFCEPRSQLLDFVSFKAHFDIRCPKDDELIAFLRNCSQRQLQQVVQFTSGKPRLPFLHVGEPKLCVSWFGKGLPTASNCTNLLILDPERTCQESLHFIFEWDTVFGTQ